MSELQKRRLTVPEFKKQYPRIYQKIIDTYGGRDCIFDMQAAIELWLRDDPPPHCDICNIAVSITRKFRQPQSAIKCKKHVNTRVYVSVADLEQVLPPHVHVDTSTLPEKFVPHTKISLICDIHGRYRQVANYVLNGGQCQKCYHENKGGTVGVDEWRTRSKLAHNGKYDYTSVDFKALGSDVTLNCPVHGVFTQNAGVHMRGHGCKKCGNVSISERLLLTTEEFITRSSLRHNNIYDYSKTVYKSSRELVTITCKKHGDFDQVAYYHLNGGNGCPKCGMEQSTFKSAAEYEIIDFLKSHGVQNIEHSWHGLGFELDIYLPDYRLAIEYNGIYWHSSGSKDTDERKSKSHLEKTTKCEKNGITLLHVLDAEWNDPVQCEIWKSTILHKMGKSARRIYARKCGVVIVPHKTATAFFQNNHLQGSAASMLNIGLMHCGELVSVASFSKARFSKDKTDFEIIRFASLTNTAVVGGFQKIIAEFERTHTGSLISYANRRWSQGNVYNKSGFVAESVSGPCYYYTDCKKLWHRSIFQKHKLADKLEQYDANKTEVENMYENKYRRIWDCGHIKFRKAL